MNFEDSSTVEDLRREVREANTRFEQLVKKITGIDAENLSPWANPLFLKSKLSNVGISFDPSKDHLTHSVIDALESLLCESDDVRSLFLDTYCPSTVWFNRDGIGEKVVDYFNLVKGSSLLSVGCSQGSEMYSIALSLLDAGHSLDDYTLKGVDINPIAIQQARAGSYFQKDFSRPYRNFLSVEQRTLYFTEEGDFVVARDDLRDNITFETADVTDLDSLSLAVADTFDIVLCRNVLKYFDEETRKTALNNLTPFLSPGALLCIGKEEEERQMLLLEDCGFEKVGYATYKFLQ